MFDTTVPMMGLAMRARTLENIPCFDLPKPYSWRFFQPGDERIWAEIETSAGEFATPEEGLKRFRTYFPTDDGLDARMIFLTDAGHPFATATAWFSDGGPSDPEGRLHWVSVDQAHQGQGLSKAVVSLAMHRLQELGHTSAYLTTKTASWVAIKVYHRFGFLPDARKEEELEGWRIVSEKTGIDFMKDLR